MTSDVAAAAPAPPASSISAPNEQSVLWGRGTANEEVVLGYHRSPIDLLRIFVLTVIVVAAMLLLVGIEREVLPLERDLSDLVDRLPTTVDRIVHGALEWLGFAILGVIALVPLATRRFRLFGYVLLADTLAIGAMALVLWPLNGREARAIVQELTTQHGISTTITSGEVGIAVWAASFTVLAPFVPRRIRHIGAVGLAVVVILRLVLHTTLFGNVLLAVPVGALAGTVVLLVLGRPSRRPSDSAVRMALVRNGLPVADIELVGEPAPGSSSWLAALEDGRRVDVLVSGEARRAAEVLERSYRFARFKDLTGDHPFLFLRHVVEHRALLSYASRDAGARTPAVQAVTPVGLDSVLAAFDHLESSPLSEAPAATRQAAVTDLFRQLAALRHRRIAHGRLGDATIRVAADGQVWLIGLELATLAADDTELDLDVAHALVTAALATDASSAVRLAVAGLGADVVGRSLPLIQPAVFDRATRTRLKAHHGLLADVPAQVQQQTGVDEVHLAQLERLDRKTLLLTIVLAGATYFLAPQFADLPGMAEQLRDANWAWTPLIVAATVVTYVGAAAGLAGSVPARMPSGSLTISQVATSFTGTVAPAGVGGMALSERYVQKQGVDRAVAVSAVGLDTVAGVVVHVSLLAVFVVWAGRRTFRGYSLPNPEWLLLGVGVVVVLAVAMLAIPATRHLLTQRLLPAVRRSFDGISNVLRRPGKLALLLGGSALVTVGNIVALFFSLVALGGDLSFASVGAVYLVGVTIASFAPTPGGIGAIEAVLISGFVAAGIDNVTAVPAVFLFRLITFWLPILPGWWAFRWLQHHDEI